MLIHFIDYFLDKKSPLGIYSNKKYSYGSKYINPNFSGLLKVVQYLFKKQWDT